MTVDFHLSSGIMICLVSTTGLTDLERTAMTIMQCILSTECFIPARQHRVQGSSSKAHCTESQLEQHRLKEATVFSLAQKEKTRVVLSTEIPRVGQ